MLSTFDIFSALRKMKFLLVLTILLLAFTVTLEAVPLVQAPMGADPRRPAQQGQQRPHPRPMGRPINDFIPLHKDTYGRYEVFQKKKLNDAIQGSRKGPNAARDQRQQEGSKKIN